MLKINVKRPQIPSPVLSLTPCVHFLKIGGRWLPGGRGQSPWWGLGAAGPAKQGSPCSHTQGRGRPPRDLGKPGMRPGGRQDHPGLPAALSTRLGSGGSCPCCPCSPPPCPSSPSLARPEGSDGLGSPAESAPTGSVVSRDSPCTPEDRSGPCLLPTPEDRPELCLSAALFRGSFNVCGPAGWALEHLHFRGLGW